MKSYFITILAALMYVVYTGCYIPEESDKDILNDKKPNIIFVLVDDMGYGDLGVLFQNQRAMKNNRNEPWQITPNLDQMANEGALFYNQYAAAPVCAPSRASLLTGRSQGHATVRNNQFDKALEDNYTMASVLKTAGYVTAAFGKWGLQGGQERKPESHDWPAHPLNRGFDYFLGYMRHADGHEHYPKEGVYRGKKEVWLNRINITDYLDKCYTADLWTAGVKKWITEQSNKKKPFFVFLAYDTPHAVMELPTQPYPEGGGLNGGLQWIGNPGYWINTATGEVDSWTYPEYASATWDDDNNPATPEVAWPEVYRRYATSIRRIDDAVGDIIRLLKDLNIDDNTIIVFSSDNGPSNESYLPEGYKRNNPSFFRSFGPFDGIKRDCWEGGVRMPVIARWPGHIKGGLKIQTPSMLFDWVPTFTEMAGLPAPAVMDGVSLLPSLTGRGRQKESTVYIEYFVGGRTPRYADFAPQHRGRIRNQMQVIRYGNYTGVRYDIKSADDDFEIYNVEQDPQQLNNLALNGNMKDIQRMMKARVLQMRVPNHSAPRPYDDALIPASDNSSAVMGYVYKIYNGEYPWVPDISGLKPFQQGQTGHISADVIKSGNIVNFSGFIDIPEDGEYSFTVMAKGKASLRIHKALVIDADYGYISGTYMKGFLKLKAGRHPVSLTYLKKGNEAGIYFKWKKVAS
ncbi:MAG: sulfatase-like hydrolase/transferase [Chlorobi bacterium]|nr:sulfatase-like hydrolase/transferase [Chlorobiota bacterium]